MIRNILLRITCKILNYYNVELIDTKLNKSFVFNNKLFEIYHYELKCEINKTYELDIKCKSVNLPK